MVCGLMCQDDGFVDHLANMAGEYVVNVRQSFQFVNGSDCDPARIEHANFHEMIYLDIFERGQTSVPHLSILLCPTEQNIAFQEVEEIMIMHSRGVNESRLKTFKEACPMSL